MVSEVLWHVITTRLSVGDLVRAIAERIGSRTLAGALSATQGLRCIIYMYCMGSNGRRP